MEHLAARLSPIGFGAFKIGRNQHIKYPQGYELPSPAEVSRLLNGVLDVGINYIDTAPAYGLSEERIGEAISHRRDEFILSTKVGERFENGQSTYDFSAAAVEASVVQSLRNLKSDVLDIVFVHANRSDMDVLTGTDVVATLMQLQGRGLIRALGFSGYTAEAFRHALGWADAIMAEYHVDNPSLGELFNEAASARKAVIVKKGLAAGRLAPETAVRFVLSHAAVTSLVVGSLNLEHIRSNVQIARQVRGRVPLSPYHR